MERFLIKLGLGLGLFLSTVSLFSQTTRLQNSWQEIDKLSFRSEGNAQETKLLNLIASFLREEMIPFYPLPYAPSSLIQSFSAGLRVSFLSDTRSEENAYFIFPLDQREGSSPSSNNAGLYIALEAILSLKNKKEPLGRNLHFLFLGGEVTRNVPIGSLFFLQNSALSFQNSLFYYFEVSNFNQWTLHTQGRKTYYITPLEQVKGFLASLRMIPSLTFKVEDSLPVKSIFQDRPSEPFATYGELSLPFLLIESPDIGTSALKDLEETLSRVRWSDFFEEIAYAPPSGSFEKTNQYYLYFQVGNIFATINSSYYLIFIFFLANFITFTGFRKVRFVNERVKQALEFTWLFVFLFFLFFLGLLATSWLSPWLLPPMDIQEVSPFLLYFKVAFANFLSFSFLYLTHSILGNLPKQTYLYMSLFSFLFLGSLVALYNLLSSFFFFLNAILVFLGLITRRKARLIFNLLSFLWLFYFVQEGVDSYWLTYFYSGEASYNLILTAGLFPYLLLILSYTTPSSRFFSRRFSRSIFSKMQTALFLGFLFAVLSTLILFYLPKARPVVEVRETWITSEEKETLRIVGQEEGESTEDLEVLRAEWIAQDLLAPAPLARSRTQAKIDWVESSLFKRQDYKIDIQFPFRPASARIVISSESPISPIVYRSDFPYEINSRGNLIFSLGPSPPENLSFSFSFSVESLSRLNLWLSFDSLPYEKEVLDKGENKAYRLLWTQRVTQMGRVVQEQVGTSLNSLNSTLEEDPNIERLRLRPLPEQKLFRISR